MKMRQQQVMTEKGQQILNFVVKMKAEFQGGEGLWIVEVYFPIRGHERYNEKRVHQHVGRQ